MHIHAHMHVLHPRRTHMFFIAKTRWMRTRHPSTAIFQPNPVLSHCHVSRTKHNSESPSWTHVPLGLKSRIFRRRSLIMSVFGSYVHFIQFNKTMEEKTCLGQPNSGGCWHTTWLLAVFITSGRTGICIQFHQEGKVINKEVVSLSITVTAPKKRSSQSRQCGV